MSLHATHGFFGGLHIPDRKALSCEAEVRFAGLPQRLYLPLQQHIGAAAEPTVQVGDPVAKGQRIARAQGYVSAAVHASTSGRVVAIERRPIAHPSGLEAPCIVIEPDGEDRWADDLPDPIPDYRQRPVSELRERIRWAGIAGMGGAAFPTGVKINPGPDHPIDTLIINGAECEPYITCDDRLMRERPGDILDGIDILLHIVGAERCLIGVEDNKPAAIASLEAALAARGADPRITIVVVPTKYPSGGEKQLIRLLTGQEVPSHGLPSELGILCQNVATTAAIARAVLQGRPVISRLVTLTGEGVRQPGNYETLIGTPFAHLVELAGGLTAGAERLILGGPMMGFAVHDTDLPVTKATNCLLVPSATELPATESPRACIRCGACAEVCPAHLLPQQLYWYARSKDLDKAQEYHLFDCIECGCCAYACPSHIPLVQYYRFAKTEIWNQEREKRQSELARQRHEARLERLDRLERERKARLRKKKEDLEKPASGGKDPKKAAVAAAMQRAAAKKQAVQRDRAASPAAAETTESGA